jgi:hypothetical protein
MGVVKGDERINCTIIPEIDCGDGQPPVTSAVFLIAEKFW